MFKRTLPLLLFAWIATAATWAANNPFVGDWKLNPSKSTLRDRMKVESVGGNKYAFDFGGGPETIVVDGTAQPSQVYRGDTLSVAAEGGTWKVVRTRNGHPMLTAIWSLSQDGNTLTDRFMGVNTDQSPYTLNYRYQRQGAGSGFAGTWVSTSVEAENMALVLQIRPYEEEGLSFLDASSQLTGNMQFAAPAVRKLDEHTVELMRKKSDGTLADFLQLKLSSDLKTLTVTPRSAPGDDPHILTFDRQ